MKIFNKNQHGFTLVELVVVVAVVGVLAVVATPKIVGVASDAKSASLKAVAGALESASASNYAAYSTTGVANAKVISTCKMAGTLLSGGTDKLAADGYVISDTTATYVLDAAGVYVADTTDGTTAFTGENAKGTASLCILNRSADSINFYAIGVGGS